MPSSGRGSGGREERGAGERKGEGRGENAVVILTFPRFKSIKAIYFMLKTVIIKLTGLGYEILDDSNLSCT